MLELLKGESGCNFCTLSGTFDTVEDAWVALDLSNISMRAASLKVLHACVIAIRLSWLLCHRGLGLFLRLFEQGLDLFDPTLNDAFLGVHEYKANVVLLLNLLLRLLLCLLAHVVSLITVDIVCQVGNLTVDLAVAASEQHLHHMDNIAAIQSLIVVLITHQSRRIELTLVDGHDLYERNHHTGLHGEALIRQEIFVDEKTYTRQHQVSFHDVVMLVEELADWAFDDNAVLRSIISLEVLLFLVVCDLIIRVRCLA